MAKHLTRPGKIVPLRSTGRATRAFASSVMSIELAKTLIYICLGLASLGIFSLLNKVFVLDNFITPFGEELPFLGVVFLWCLGWFLFISIFLFSPIFILIEYSKYRKTTNVPASLFKYFSSKYLRFSKWRGKYS